MEEGMICAGIDGGSRALKIVLIDGETHEVAASGTRDQGVDHDGLAAALFAELLEQCGARREDVRRIVATGYTRHRLTLADTAITEITCHASGVRHVAPDAMTVVEIGGQDSKVLRLDPDGRVRDFSMNDRCAAGTGRFLEVVAERLGVALDDIGRLAEECRRPAAISSMCVVFAETEIIGLLSGGVPREDIAAGVQTAIATRVAALAGGRLDGPIVFTGGVARVPGMAAALERALSTPIRLAPEPHLTGALGAALLAARQAKGQM